MAIVTPCGHGLGGKRQTADTRDYLLAPHEGLLPPAADIRVGHTTPAPRNQGQLGSCTAFAATFCAWFTYLRLGWHNPFQPSELFQYYQSRIYSGDVGVDGGASCRDAMRVLHDVGMTAETNWPYVPANVLVAPPPTATANAKRHVDTLYFACQDDTAVKASIADGWPVQIGFTVYQNFEEEYTARTGMVQLPGPGEQELGGHSMALVAYNDTTQLFTAINSWGPNFGDQGFVYLPYAYPRFDQWTLRGQR